MNRWWLGLLLVPVIAGAQSDDGNGQRGGGRSPSLAFCQERFYEEDDGLLRCNWAVNFTYACFVSYPANKVIQAGAKIAEPEVVGECDNGERIIKLLHY
ncbi:hypothetical protein [uncultured Microbulbifer sp.]|uniref:hypothetical protein n=1 Tax=uncultured Microbulbifer sp. TaxID=348147 RepID=UPI0025EE86E1|nr:hypothetical protein [uncultured Microbulbifer sp.]